VARGGVPAPPIPAVALCVVAFGMAWLCLWRSRWRLLGVPLIVAGFAAGAAQRLPDILVSADARLIALRAGDELFLQRLSGTSNLTRDVWLRLYGREVAETLPARTGHVAGGAIACEAGACSLRPLPDGPVAAVLLRGDPPAGACAGAALVVSAEPVRGRCAARVVDRFSVWRDGAHAVWLEPAGPRVLSDREARGARPWVPPQPQPRSRNATATPREAPPPSAPALE
jgi:competence protein ComEC